MIAGSDGGLVQRLWFSELLKPCVVGPLAMILAEPRTYWEGRSDWIDVVLLNCMAQPIATGDHRTTTVNLLDR